MIIIAPILAAAAMQLPPAQQELTTCYVTNTHRLYKSSEPATVITDTIMAICSHLESAARSEIRDETIKNLQQDGSTSYSEAKQIVNSIEYQSNLEWRARYNGLIRSVIMDLRLKQNS